MFEAESSSCLINAVLCDKSFLDTYKLVSFPFAGLSYLLLVGGLAESSMLQHEVRKEFGHILKIIIPQGVSTITAKGNDVLNKLSMNIRAWV